MQYMLIPIEFSSPSDRMGASGVPVCAFDDSISQRLEACQAADFACEENAQAQPQRLGEAWHQPTLFLSPESLRAERISAGESIAVAVISLEPKAKGNRKESKGWSPPPKMPLETVASRRPLSLLHLCAQKTKKSARFARVGEEASHSVGPENLGHAITIARVWPLNGLSRQGAAYSTALGELIGEPCTGSRIRVFPLNLAEMTTKGNSERLYVDVHTTLTPILKPLREDNDDWTDRAEMQSMGEKQRTILETLYYRVLRSRKLCFSAQVVVLPVLGVKRPFQLEFIGTEKGGGDGESVDPADQNLDTSTQTHSDSLEKPIGVLQIKEQNRVHLCMTPEEQANISKSVAGEGASTDPQLYEEFSNLSSFAYEALCAGARMLSGVESAVANPGADGFLSALKGVDKVTSVLQEAVVDSFRNPDAYFAFGLNRPVGILLHGTPGTGKTLLAKSAARDSNAHVLLVNGPSIVVSGYGETEKALKSLFDAAIEIGNTSVHSSKPSKANRSGCILFFDEIDALAAAAEGSADEAFQSRVSATLATLFDRLSSLAAFPEYKLMVIATTNRPDSLDKSLRRPGRFDTEIEVSPPGPASRMQMVSSMLEGVQHDLTETQIKSLADNTHGYVGADLRALCTEAIMTRLRRDIQSSHPEKAHPFVGLRDFESARQAIVPSAMRELVVEVPQTPWTAVGGNEEIKRKLQEVVELPFRDPAAFAQLGIEAPTGVLLYGPPGCSKTLLARAVATESSLNFIAIKGPELLSKYVGESEKAMKQLFSRARQAAPAIVFIDEIDGIAGIRQDNTQEGDGGVGIRVLSQLLQELDGVCSSSQVRYRVAQKEVVTLAATNRPDRLDSALLRPGRFDRLLYVPLPDEDARESIFRIHLERSPKAEDVDLGTLSKMTKGYSGADISQVCREAAFQALEEDIDACTICQRNLTSALRRIRPSPKGDLESIYKAFQRQTG